jgi:hypothetical protein
MPPTRKPPPRRPSTSSDAGLRRPFVLVGAAALAAGLVLAGVLVATRDESSAVLPKAALTAAGCTLRTFPDQGQRHVDSYDAKVSYNSNPPTSGTHHERPVIWGAYDDEVPAVAEVHNLEHGGVIVHYGEGVDAATVGELRAFYAESANGVLLAPFPGLGDRITLSAWTRVASCRSFDEKAFSAFRSAYRGNGPERFRIGDLQPGT